MIELLRDFGNIIEKERAIEIENDKLVIVGDLHGSFNDLKCILEKTSIEKRIKGEDVGLIFLGDYVDRALSADEQVKLLRKLFEMKIKHPENVFLLKGNHEDITCSFYWEQEYPIGWKTAFTRIFNDEKIIKKMVEIFDMLPIAATKEKTILLHGFVPYSKERVITIEEIEKAELRDDIYEQILWNDPNRFGKTRRSMRGIGYEVGKEDFEKFMEKNKLEKLVRAHEPVENGTEDIWKDGKAFTVFSNNEYYNIGRIGFLEI